MITVDEVADLSKRMLNHIEYLQEENKQLRAQVEELKKQVELSVREPDKKTNSEEKL